MKFNFKFERGKQFIWTGTLGKARVGAVIEDISNLRPERFNEVRSLVQVHENTVYTDECYENSNQEGDGLISGRASTLLMIRTADCLPVTMVSEHKIGLIHAGWRSLKDGILEAAVKKMECPDISVILGPSIFWENYEVDRDCYESWNDPDIHRFLHPGQGSKKYLDIRGMARKILQRSGIKGHNIYQVPLCTFRDGLPSYRREGKKAGRIINYIWFT